MSHIFLWPFVGWLEVPEARWLWAATTVAAGAWLIYLIVLGSRAESNQERCLVALMFLSMNATGVTVGNGQLTIHVLAVLLAGTLILCQGNGRWLTHLWGALLFILGLVKPTITAPFFWTVLFVPNRLRPAALVVGGYAALTLFAAQFQEGDILSILHGWVRAGMALNAESGYRNIHIWMSYFGLTEWRGASRLLGVSIPQSRHLDPAGCHRAGGTVVDVPSDVR